MPQSDKPVDLNKIYSRLDKIEELVKNYHNISEALAYTTKRGSDLEAIVKKQNEAIITYKTEAEEQTKKLDSIKDTYELPLTPIFENNEIIENMVGIVKGANTFVIILTNQITASQKESKELNDFFNHLRDKVACKGVKRICIRYNTDPSKRNIPFETSAKQDILKRLGEDTNILDVEHIDNIHLRLLMNENRCLIFSNNITPLSFREKSLEIAILINDIRVLENIRSKIAEIYKLEIPS